ncbi:MAG: YgfZ/GcvT domain-containing protein [Pseudomonadales bacterium]
MTTERQALLDALVQAPRLALQDELQICPLPEQALIQVEGIDSERFLQGQLSCDIKQVNTDGSAHGAHCSIKGSILSLYRVINAGQDYFLTVHASTLDASLALLQKYILFSKAEAASVTDSWLCFGIAGAKADTLLEEYTDGPLADNQVCLKSDSIVVKLPNERYQLWLSLTAAERFTTLETVTAHLQDAEYWHYLQISNGEPSIQSETADSYIPQMCNLQALGGVSFKKGCYTGQEVITRLQFRGKLTKYLALAKISCDALQEKPQVGDWLDCSDKDKAAQVLQVAEHSGNYYLSYVVNKRFDQQPLSLKGCEVSSLPLPYTLDPQLFERKA